MNADARRCKNKGRDDLLTKSYCPFIRVIFEIGVRLRPAVPNDREACA
jgi:hypothetical protein